MLACERTSPFSFVRRSTKDRERVTCAFCTSSSEDQRTHALPFGVHQTVSLLLKTEVDQARIRQSVGHKQQLKRALKRTGNSHFIFKLKIPG